jgi:hypothetical protein
MTSASRRRATGLAVGFLVLAVAAGCGSDDDAAESTGTTRSESSTGATQRVTAVDYSFEDLPATIPAGTKLQLHNDAPSELHEMVVVRRPDGETRPASELVKLPESELDAIFGGGPPALVVLARPGEDGEVAVGKAKLPAGEYVLFCAIPQGVDPDEYLDPANQTEDGPPNVQGGPPHFTLGMASDLTVE